MFMARTESSDVFTQTASENDDDDQTQVFGAGREENGVETSVLSILSDCHADSRRRREAAICFKNAPEIGDSFTFELFETGTTTKEHAKNGKKIFKDVDEGLKQSEKYNGSVICETTITFYGSTIAPQNFCLCGRGGRNPCPQRHNDASIRLDIENIDEEIILIQKCNYLD
ncbi:hypothetical protein CRE_01402 [Caenorhabditis remanei]|uniref:Uncharacterized protein n=1 Tax=Caenorhabditis remanei TaxID=31234 RepID=E3NHV9_CAERE|nr:hypothetical protein CRE_01402 [Caenorhabditis remanei]